MQALKPPMGLQLSEDTLEGLTERIDMRQPLAAFASYQKIVESGSSYAFWIGFCAFFSFC